MIHIEKNYEPKLFKGRIIERHRYIASTASAAIIALVAAGAHPRYPTQGKNDR